MSADRNEPGSDAAMIVHETGDTHSRVVLLLHGSIDVGGSMADWGQVLTSLGATFHCVAPDLNKLGAATLSASQSKATADALVLSILELLDEAGVSRFTVIGSGLGGGIALQLAALIPARVQAVVLSGFESIPAAFDEQLLTPRHLAGVVQPALVLHGRQDTQVPLESSLHLSTHIPRADLYVLPRSGHWSQIDQPRRFTTAIHDFVLRHNS